MSTVTVLPRQTPSDRAEEAIAVVVDGPLVERANAIDEWVRSHECWEFALYEGHYFGRANNVEGRLTFAAGAQTSTLVFRLDQLDGVSHAGDELVIKFEDREGIPKLARLTEHGLSVALFHILSYA